VRCVDSPAMALENTFDVTKLHGHQFVGTVDTDFVFKCKEERVLMKYEKINKIER
jgi:hypothetical protein